VDPLSRWASLSRDQHRTIDPHALKIAAPKGRNLHQRKELLLHFRLNQDSQAMTMLNKLTLASGFALRPGGIAIK
jgi:hypothetical protein